MKVLLLEAMGRIYDLSLLSNASVSKATAAQTAN